LIAYGKQGDLMQKIGEKDTILINIGEDAEKALAVVKTVPGVDTATATDGTLKLLSGRGRQTLTAVIKVLDDCGFALQSVEVKEPNLEAVFLELTGRALRD
jgi:ABC-2 type transport system ATP-binding protein